jgi:hypothetical protein
MKYINMSIIYYIVYNYIILLDIYYVGKKKKKSDCFNNMKKQKRKKYTWQIIAPISHTTVVLFTETIKQKHISLVSLHIQVIFYEFIKCYRKTKTFIMLSRLVVD